MFLSQSSNPLCFSQRDDWTIYKSLKMEKKKTFNPALGQSGTFKKVVRKQIWQGRRTDGSVEVPDKIGTSPITFSSSSLNMRKGTNGSSHGEVQTEAGEFQNSSEDFITSRNGPTILVYKRTPTDQLFKKTRWKIIKCTNTKCMIIKLNHQPRLLNKKYSLTNTNNIPK